MMSTRNTHQKLSTSPMSFNTPSNPSSTSMWHRDTLSDSYPTWCSRKCGSWNYWPYWILPKRFELLPRPSYLYPDPNVPSPDLAESELDFIDYDVCGKTQAQIQQEVGQ